MSDNSIFLNIAFLYASRVSLKSYYIYLFVLYDREHNTPIPTLSVHTFVLISWSMIGHQRTIAGLFTSFHHVGIRDRTLIVRFGTGQVLLLIDSPHQLQSDFCLLTLELKQNET